MDRGSLTVPGGPDRRKQIEDAKAMYQTVVRNAERTNTGVPPYDFVELIGKGAFGRVYKCKKRDTGQLVAVKIVNIDEEDFRLETAARDESIRDFRKEVSILHQLKESKAKNINMIHDAFDLHSQLWIVSDYCTGGSVRTLMRANLPTQPGLEEQYIIPIARELAIAMKCVHDIGVIHRDIKCTNVYVSEEGELQLGDFGIVGIMEDGSSKRATVIGTPWYMPKEMLDSLGTGAPVPGGYGTEIDVWAYGCTIYEMATGQVPNQKLPAHSLSMRLEEQEPRLEGGQYSDELRDFVAFCLVNDPNGRPAADDILDHPFIHNSSKKYPTTNLVSLIERYAMWEYKGGVRASLWMAGGAEAPQHIYDAEEIVAETDHDDWNFSTSDTFDKDFANRLSRMLDLGNIASMNGNAGTKLPPLITTNLLENEKLTPLERVQRDHQDRSASRGEKSLNRVFDALSEPYELHTPIDDKYQPPPLPTTSDLPLRDPLAHSEPRESVIDLDAGFNYATPSFNFEFEDIRTIKARSAGNRLVEDRDNEEPEYVYNTADGKDAKRATQDWKFPGLTVAAPSKRATMDWTFPKLDPTDNEMGDGQEVEIPGPGGLAPGFRPALKHTATAPVGQLDYLHTFEQPIAQIAAPGARESVMSMVDLDAGLMTVKSMDRRPSTASSSTAGSTATDVTSGNPFDLEDDVSQHEDDRKRFSHHKQWRSEGGNGSGRNSLRSMPMHDRGISLSSTDSDLEIVTRKSASGQSMAYEYNRKMSDAMRDQISLSLDKGASALDLNQWPDFGPGEDTLGPPIRRGFNGPVALGLSPSSVHDQESDGKRVIEYPVLSAPNPEVLLEDCPPQAMINEFERLLDEMEHGFKATAKAIRMHSRPHDEDGLQMSGNDSTIDSSSLASGTEDDSGY